MQLFEGFAIHQRGGGDRRAVLPEVFKIIPLGACLLAKQTAVVVVMAHYQYRMIVLQLVWVFVGVISSDWVIYFYYKVH